jgi:hypothetical protein
MKLNRSAFTQHLQRISCGGRVTEAAFSSGFATTALTEDHLLCVIAPSLPKAEPLPAEIGVADLSRLIKGVGLLAGAGNEGTEVVLDVEDFRLVIHEEHRGELLFLTAAPTTIGTRVADETRDKLLANAPSEDGISLSKAAVEGIQKAFSWAGAEEVELQIGKKSSQVVVGNENSHMGKVPLPDLKSKTEFTLLFGEHFIDVLGVITNYSDAKLFLGGPKAFAVVHDGEYRYLLSPRTRGAEAG